MSIPSKVPFYRPQIGDAEVEEVVAALKSGWLTTGPRVKQFEQAFTAAVGSSHAVAMNSCTAALHLAVRVLGLRQGEGVLVPAMTFAATAEVVRYEGGIPIFVDCDCGTLNMDLTDAERVIALLRSGAGLAGLPPGLAVVGMIPVHVGGMMMDVDGIQAFARRHNLWVVEDAAHAFPAAWRSASQAPWQHCGQNTAGISCFSFYANKTITTGEGGMATTANRELADQMRLLSLHGLSHDAWGRYSGNGSWDYRILAPGYKYNMTDIAAAIGIHQLSRGEEMRRSRETIALEYIERLSDLHEIETPSTDGNRLHSWHLFPIRLHLGSLTIDRNAFMNELSELGVSSSVHWRPLHLHPYYEETFGWRPGDLPVASAVWTRLISLPIFSAMTRHDIDAVVNAVRSVCNRFRRPVMRTGDQPPVVAMTQP
jgi:perosamine synthetase